MTADRRRIRLICCSIYTTVICGHLSSKLDWASLRLRHCRNTHFNRCRSKYKCVLYEDFTPTRCGKL